ncbi:MlrC C-terminal domain-containing protein [Ensifer sp. IC3342]|nr:MlrC C-terminal domain-containing protein [Ensifer sp. BRP08]MCA1451228.1 MlrC C-terminal domain-containing protein [Ensifer sp. IC3342]
MAASALEDRGPVLMLDHGDNCMSGGTCENMDVLQAALEAGLTGIVAGPINDPDAVRQAMAAGVGAEVEISVGNKIPADGFPPPLPSLKLTGHVSAIGDGRYTIEGPIYTGMVCNMGRCAVIDTGRARVLIAEETHEPWDQAVFTSLGIDPASAGYLILKSLMYCRPVFEPLSKAVVECAGGGVTGSDYGLFPFRKLRQPIYPIDMDVVWEQPHD